MIRYVSTRTLFGFELLLIKLALSNKKGKWMKLYYFPGSPSPRKVGIFISEKGLEIPSVTLNLREGEHLTEEFAGYIYNVPLTEATISNYQKLY